MNKGRVNALLFAKRCKIDERNEVAPRFDSPRLVVVVVGSINFDRKLYLLTAPRSTLDPSPLIITKLRVTMRLQGEQVVTSTERKRERVRENLSSGVVSSATRFTRSLKRQSGERCDLLT